jgi:acetyl-CoA C-acetyltransferase
MENDDIVLAGGARTPIGGFCGTLGEVSAPVLGATAVKAALQRAGVPLDQVNEVIFGNVLSAGLGQNVARQAAIKAGLSPAVGATTVNKVCGSGLKSVMFAAQTIRCGEAGVIVAGGTENMSAAPYIIPRARTGYRMGNGEIVDLIIRDGLWDVYNNVHMGSCGDRCAERCKFTRQQQDDYAVASYKRAIEADQKCYFADEIVPVEIAGRKGTVTVAKDEEPTRFNEEKLRKPSTRRSARGERSRLETPRASTTARRRWSCSRPPRPASWA